MEESRTDVGGQIAADFDEEIEAPSSSTYQGSRLPLHLFKTIEIKNSNCVREGTNVDPGKGTPKKQPWSGRRSPEGCTISTQQKTKLVCSSRLENDHNKTAKKSDDSLKGTKSPLKPTRKASSRRKWVVATGKEARNHSKRAKLSQYPCPQELYKESDIVPLPSVS
ncbi:hypothetical protein SLEP1_g33910 [Rubroshorea leprosula]|uniref:Uncharacterized protein n=1 Tax=Rubroshorea leprosula TaxID=152421 RepID=A0AAV5KI54_9ROSI|nr:hypothetical protein SLEP1_g33910 [Rubroshorea leprosula]